MKRLVLFSSVLVSAVLMTACATDPAVPVTSSTSSENPYSIPDLELIGSEPESIATDTDDNDVYEVVTGTTGENQPGVLSDSLDDFTICSSCRNCTCGITGSVICQCYGGK